MESSICESIHQHHKKVKEANGDCLRREGAQWGEGRLLTMEDQEQEQGNTAPRDDQG